MTPRLFKEVSVAGESPGKSEQRKSSGTAEERDPRLAVFREPGAAADGNTTDGTTGTATDSETAVFRLPRSAEADASQGASAPSEGAEGPGGASTPREGAEGGAEADDAAGAAKAAPGAPADAAGPEAEGGSGAEADSGRPETDEQPEAGAAEAGADSDPAAGAEPAAGSEQEEASEAAPAAAATPDAEPGAGAETDAEPGERPEGASGSESGPDAGSTPTDARLRAAVAAWVATGPDDESAVQGGAAEAGDKPSEGDGKAAGGDGADATDERAVSADGAATADAGKAPTDDEEPSADTDAVAPATRDTEASASADADAGADVDTDASADTDDVPAVTASGDAPRVPRTRAEASPAEEPEPARDGRGIDHPTAVFKAPRADQFDRPTTALKLPPKQDEAARKPASWAAKSSGAPEAPAERTSKFVPLRSDDVRPAAVVGPTVTPDVAAGPGTPGAPGAGLTEAERTRQQPMPPRPPLDLLAELTNTPPPPETPVRTAVRRVKIWTPLVLLALVIFAIAQAVRPLPDPALTLTASPTYTFGGEKLDMPWPAEGQGAVEVEGVGAIGSYGKEKSAPIASMAKVMTAYVILKDHPITGKQIGEQIAVDKRAGEEASLEDESRVAIEEGQKYSEHQMLEMLMIPSGNNVARLLARWDAGTEKAFVEKMNQAAEDLGMTNSTYTDPSGLKSSTVSTPADQIKLGKAVMQSDVFREIVNQPQADIPNVGRIYNNNYILLEPGVSGIKTGSSTPAGGNLLWTADTVVDGKSRRIIGAVMGATLDGTLDAKLERARQNSLKLIQAAQKGVESATVVKKGQVVGYVDNGLGGQTPVVATKDLKAVGWGGLEVDLKLTDGDKTPAHAAKAGTVVGEVTVGTGTGQVSAPVALQSEMTEPGFGDKLTRIT
ncbi:D-alanyl-D-alanine carboxypeptidase [Streptomyces sp. NPDC060209]|uniref:D-alanyl-D-alanine carboxypeptidase n=1 Tax=Streptomyces sp. NPDC060209 TaxID=3347073 RepID=UPI0036661578